MWKPVRRCFNVPSRADLKMDVSHSSCGRSPTETKPRSSEPVSAGEAFGTKGQTDVPSRRRSGPHGPLTLRVVRPFTPICTPTCKFPLAHREHPSIPTNPHSITLLFLPLLVVFPPCSASTYSLADQRLQFSFVCCFILFLFADPSVFSTPRLSARPVLPALLLTSV